jgi:hypothetical protein
MDNKFRITRTPNLHTVASHEILWAGPHKPDTEVIKATKYQVQQTIEERGHDPFNQAQDDTLLLQEKRHPSLLGWKTLEAMNIYQD